MKISQAVGELSVFHWTYEMPVRYILSSVWVRLSTFSQLSIIQYMGLCVFSLPIPLVMIKRIYTLSYYHHQIGRMNYYPLFRVRSWNNGVRCMSLYILFKHVPWEFVNMNRNAVLIPCAVTVKIVLLYMFVISVWNYCWTWVIFPKHVRFSIAADLLNRNFNRN